MEVHKNLNFKSRNKKYKPLWRNRRDFETVKHLSDNLSVIKTKNF